MINKERLSPQRHKGHEDGLFTEDNEANEGKIRTSAQWSFQSPTFVSFVAFCKKIRLRVLCAFVVNLLFLLVFVRESQARPDADDGNAGKKRDQCRITSG